LRACAIGREPRAVDFGKPKKSRGDVGEVNVGLYATSAEGGEAKLGAALRRLTAGQSFTQRVLEKRCKYGAIEI
jgi:hypothetical protein